GNSVRVTIGSQPRARIATPFHDFCPTHTAPYPAFSSAAFENSASAALSSCSATTSGLALRSQASRLPRRLLMLLMLKVAIFMRRATCSTGAGTANERSDIRVLPASIDRQIATRSPPPLG